MKLKEKICYGTGIIPGAVSATIISLYLLYFCTDVLGLAALAVGAIILIANIFDIVTDLLIMNFVDSHPTKFGTYRPWLFSVIPMGICLFLLFSTPSFLDSNTKKLIWVAILYFLLVPIFGTAYLCPFISLRTRLTNDHKEQIQLGSAASFFENIGQLVAVILITQLVIYRDILSLSNWRLCVAIMLAIMIINILICVFGTKEKITATEKKVNIFAGIKVLIKNASFLKVVAMLSVIYIPWMAYSSLLTYFCAYNLGHEEWMTYVAIFSLLFSALMSFVISPLAAKIGKKSTITLCCAALLLSAVVFVFTNNIWLLLVFCMIKDFGQMGIYICSFSYIPEIDERTRNLSKFAITGLIVGITSAISKIGSAIGSYSASAVLTLGSYDASLAAQSDSTLAFIRYSVVALYVLASVIIFFINKNGVFGKEKPQT